MVMRSAPPGYCGCFNCHADEPLPCLQQAHTAPPPPDGTTWESWSARNRWDREDDPWENR